MGDIFGAAGDSLSWLGDTADSVLTKLTVPGPSADGSSQSAFMKAVGAAGQSMTSGNNESKGFQGLSFARKLDQMSNIQPVNGSDANKNRPGQSEASKAVNPLDVEAEWTARLAKYAGIAQATGTKVK